MTDAFSSLACQRVVLDVVLGDVLVDRVERDFREEAGDQLLVRLFESVTLRELLGSEFFFRHALPFYFVVGHRESERGR